MGKDKTLKQAYTFKPRKDEADEIKEFLIKQSNFCDAVRYLIEKEISENGIRDIVQYIPSVRNINNIKSNTVTEPSIKKATVTKIQKKPNISDEISAEKISNETEKIVRKSEENHVNVDINKSAINNNDDGIPDCYL